MLNKLIIILIVIAVVLGIGLLAIELIGPIGQYGNNGPTKSPEFVDRTTQTPVVTPSPSYSPTETPNINIFCGGLHPWY